MIFLKLKKSKYSNTIEELFSRHLERMIMKRHVVPKYKVRYSPFFSDRYFKFNTNDAIPLQLSCNLGWYFQLRNSLFYIEFCYTYYRKTHGKVSL